MSSLFPTNPAEGNAAHCRLHQHQLDPRNNDDDSHRRRRNALVASLSAACDSVNGESVLETARRRLRRVIKANSEATEDADFEAVIRSARRKLRPADSRPLPPAKSCEPAAVDPEDEAALLGLPDFAYLLQQRLKELKPAQETPVWIKQAIAAAAATAGEDTDSQAASETLDNLSVKATAATAAAAALETTTTSATTTAEDVFEDKEEVSAKDEAAAAVIEEKADENLKQDVLEIPQQQQHHPEQVQQLQEQQLDVRRNVPAQKLSARRSRSLIEQRCHRLLQGLECAFKSFQDRHQLPWAREPVRQRHSLLGTGLQICCEAGGIGIGAGLLTDGEEQKSVGMATAKICQILLKDPAEAMGTGVAAAAAVSLELSKCSSLPPLPAAASSLPELEPSLLVSDHHQHQQHQEWHHRRDCKRRRRRNRSSGGASRPSSSNTSPGGRGSADATAPPTVYLQRFLDGSEISNSQQQQQQRRRFFIDSVEVEDASKESSNSCKSNSSSRLLRGLSDGCVKEAA